MKIDPICHDLPIEQTIDLYCAAHPEGIRGQLDGNEIWTFEQIERVGAYLAPEDSNEHPFWYTTLTELLDEYGEIRLVKHPKE